MISVKKSSEIESFTLKKRLDDGTYIVYSKKDPNTILEIGTYKNRKKNGIWTILNQVTKSKDSLTYLNGLLINKKRTDSSNRVTENTIFTKDSILGTYYQYAKENSIRYKIEYKSLKNNKYSFTILSKYHDNGNLNLIKKKRRIRNNTFSHTLTYYYNGKLKSEFFIQNEKRIGVWKWWNKNGELCQIDDYDKTPKKRTVMCIINYFGN